MGDFYPYLTAFWAHWWPIVITGAYLGFDEAARAWWPGVTVYLDRIPGWWRRRIAVAVLLASVFYAGFAVWHEEHAFRLAAERALAGKSERLTRSVAYDDVDVALVQEDGGGVLRGLAGRINNVGQDTINLKIANLSLFVGGKQSVSGPLGGWIYIPPNHGILLSNYFLKPNINIVPGIEAIILVVSVDYDTASPSGLRHSYRKMQFFLTWTDGKFSRAGTQVMEERED